MNEDLEELERLGRLFEQQAKCNPPQPSCYIFEAYLIEMGIDPDVFSRDIWWQYLERKGLSGDEIVNYFQDSAEWMPNDLR